jgi:16S rRNA G527 N7-methylase RsmG
LNSGISKDIPYFSSQAIFNKYDTSGRLSAYLQDIQAYNKKVNLVSRETSFDDLVRIAADCLVPFELQAAPSGKIFDIGAGAGFPSLVLLLGFSGLEGVIFERTGKKALFLESMVRGYKLNAEVISGDFLTVSGNIPSESFDYGFMKYVHIERKILSTALLLLKPFGCFIYYSRSDLFTAEEPEGIVVRTIPYYLDDQKQVRTISIFSAKP